MLGSVGMSRGMRGMATLALRDNDVLSIQTNGIIIASAPMVSTMKITICWARAKFFCEPVIARRLNSDLLGGIAVGRFAERLIALVSWLRYKLSSQERTEIDERYPQH